MTICKEDASNVPKPSSIKRDSIFIEPDAILAIAKDKARAVKNDSPPESEATERVSPSISWSMMARLSELSNRFKV